MSTVTLLGSELEAHSLMSRGRFYMSTTSDSSAGAQQIRKDADYIIQLAERIKADRQCSILNSVSNLKGL